MKKLLWVACATFCLLGSTSTHATPYASCITISGTLVNFDLNEPGGNVTVTYEDGTANANFNGLTTGTNLPAGSQSFDLGAHTGYSISVYKAGNGKPSIITNI